MTSDTQITAVDLNRLGVSMLRRRWGWYVGLGFLLIVLGAIALGSSVLVTLVTMVFVGWLMIIGGVVEAVHAFSCREWGGFFIDLLTGILYTVVGFMIIANPGATAVTLTLLIAMFLIFGGIFRVAVALINRFPHWGWVMLHGAVTFALGILIWRQFPVAGLWVIGLFVGIDMILNGWSLVMLGLAARALPNTDAPAA